MNIGPMNNAMNLIATSQQRLAGAAQQIARAPVRDTTGQEMTRPLVSLLEARTEAMAGAKLVKTADDMIGTLLDVRA